MLTDEQLAQRRLGITATDVAKIAGQSPYGCGEDVRLDKMGAGRPFIEHARVRWGNILEGPIRIDYAERHGVEVIGGDEIGTLQHPHETWALTTPDGIVYACWTSRAGMAPAPPGPRKFARAHSGPPLRGHEVKTHTSWLSNLYGEPGTDQVPPWELIQCVWNIWVASAFYGVQLERWDLTVFMDGLPTDFVIMRDVDLETSLVEMCREFWQVHVIGGEPVPPDGSEAYSEIIALKWPKHEPGKVIEATAEHRRSIRELRAARNALSMWNLEEETLTQEVKLAIGDAESLTWTEAGKPQKITWKQGADKETVGWKGAMTELYDFAERHGLGQTETWHLEDLIASHTETKPGARPFNTPRSWR